MYKISYFDPGAPALLREAMQFFFPSGEEKPIIICIGSERHILDCLGPLTGTMLESSQPELLVYGTLDQPLHARNIIKQMQLIKQNYPHKKIMAVDASAGEEEEIGMLQLRPGGLIPGKALFKNLPLVGDYSLTGIVENRVQARAGGSSSNRGLAHVYHMAEVIQKAVCGWYDLTK